MRLSLMVLLLILATSCKIRHDNKSDSIFASAKRYNQNYRLDWDNLSEANKITYLQFNFDQFPMDDTYKISIIDSFQIEKGLLLNDSESKKLMKFVTDSSNFEEGQCGTFYINAGFVMVKNDTIIGTIEIGCGFGQWRFNPKNEHSKDNILSDKGFESMSKLLDEINMRKKNARTHNTGYTSGGIQSNLQAQGSLARAVTVDSESATEPARCIPSTLGARQKKMTMPLRNR